MKTLSSFPQYLQQHLQQLLQHGKDHWRDYVSLMRLDRPIGILLVLWPTVWALWLAADGMPSFSNLIIFALGVVFMRSAGCVINDFADRKVDGHVERTKGRPLATGALNSKQALTLFGVLVGISFLLVLFTNTLTILLSFGAVILASIYPFMKRYTHLPQVVLGAAFSWAVLMAFAAETNHVPKVAGLIYIAVVLWTVAYDTFYAMVDRDDDVKIGVKSTAILFGDADRVITGTLQGFTILCLVLAGNQLEMHWPYYLGLTAASGLFAYQQYLIKDRQRDACFSAFLNNNWVGVVIFMGIVMNDLAA